MEIIVLQSGSTGNCTYVESRGVRLLFDAGISGKQAQARLAAHGRDIADVQGLLISHDHRDHSRCMGVYQRKFGLPVHVTKGTLTVASQKENLGTLSDVRHFRAGSAMQFGPLSVETISTPHDGVDGVAFVVDDGRRRVGILIDLGHVFDGLSALVKSLDAVIIESNHDRDMLTNGQYPEHLKRRIRGRGGHLSNSEAAELVGDAAARRLKWACLGHLSEDNNEPELAVEAHRRVVGRRLPLFVASRYEAIDVLEI